MKGISVREKDNWQSWDFEDLMTAYSELEKTSLKTTNIEEWLAHWSQTAECCDELYNRLYVATTVNTMDQDAAARLEQFMWQDYPRWQSAEQKLKQKLLDSGHSVPGLEVPLCNMRAEVELFREENLPLFAQEEQLNSAHDQIMGAQTVEWQGEECTAPQMEAVLLEPERALRQTAWERLAERQLQDREDINRRWTEYYRLRAQIARNADLPDYRAFRWQQLKRIDYSPTDCRAFHRAIEEVVVPVVSRLAERRKKVLKIDRLRYFDLLVDLTGKDALRPFQGARELIEKASAVFSHLHADLGEYFRIMDREGLLDLENRVNKAAGGYCTDFARARRPFIFANVVGVHEDVLTIMHEGGHAFHSFERFRLPYFQQRAESSVPTEFLEVASMAMELLAAPYFEEKYGGFYSSAEASRALAEQLENILQFWPYMAIVDEFQNWVYEYPEQGVDPRALDAKWAELEMRFRPHIDWGGCEEVMMTGWQRKDHIHQSPFYYIEYGLALLGAAQVWRNALQNPAQALQDYRTALALGGTATLPQLFRAAGARLAFDARTLRAAVELMEKRINEIEAAY